MTSDYSNILHRYSHEGRLRAIPEDCSGSGCLDMTSNDYLGLGKRWKEYTEEFYRQFPDASFSSSASRLLSRRQSYHVSLEFLLSELYGRDVLLFNSGYHANVGIIQSLAIEGTVFLCDKLIHASMIDGLRMAGAEHYRWRHNDVPALEKLLEKHDDKRCIVLFESIYSMDGDIAPIKDIVALKSRFPNMMLYMDEAHAFGCRGKNGLGIAEEYGLIDEIDILVGTLGKAAASAGAFVATSKILKDYFINSARSFIFSTALPPINAAWSEFMVRKIVGMSTERQLLAEISLRFRNGLKDITGIDCGSSSHIVPLHIGDAVQAVRIAAELRDRGIDVLPIRRPTVPAGGERIRFSLSADMGNNEINRALNEIKEIYSSPS